MKTNKWLALIACFVFSSSLLVSADAQTKAPWIHVEVQEKKGEGEYVKVNLPLSMVDVALNVVKDEKLRKGRLKLHSHEISLADMRQLWNELKKAGDAEFVTVQKKSETVRVARQGEFVVVKVTENQQPKVDLKVPVEVVDALLSGPEDELDLKAAIAVMQQKRIGEVLTVNDQSTHVRVWID